MRVLSQAVPIKCYAFLAVNAIMFMLFWLAGAGIWYWGVWVLAMATWLSLVTRIRNNRRARLHFHRRRSI